jgi:arylsulfatase A-like enzyme/Tfp pilus assembly protein PilF
MRLILETLTRVALAIMLLPGVATATESKPEPAARQEAPEPVSLVLLTLDTTRADALGSYGGAASTPNLDRLASEGLRFERAVTPSPLTLPAHASLLTGLDPPQHGVRDNGTAVLPEDIPTLATVLERQGYTTAAFVSSRVLDRRFGLGRGFETYDDRMLAERVGEYGYPERDAATVTDAALAWLDGSPADRPVFLWVHYYDPHAPYQPPPEFRGDDSRSNYLGEVGFVDREIGRLLEAVRKGRQRIIVVAVGDHGESLGEHGERTHGIFLYRAAVEVPLVVSGTGVPRGAVVSRPVGIRRLASTLSRLVEIDGFEELGPPLPGFGFEGADEAFPPIYGEAMMPATTYGWTELRSVSQDRWRYVEAPRPELYDVVADPEESVNRVVEEAETAERLRALLEGFGRRQDRSAAVPELDAETEAALRSLGYLGGAAGEGDGIDPKDGVGLLARFEEAKGRLGRGEVDAAIASFEELVRSNPSNTPFRVRLGEAQLAAGRSEKGLASYRAALASNPRSEFLRLRIAHALRELGRNAEAKAAYLEVLEIDRRSAAAWMWLAALEGDQDRERDVLREAVEAGADSVTILVRLAWLERERDRLAEAEELLGEACALAPDSAMLWIERGELALARKRDEDAMSFCTRAQELEPANPLTALCVARVYIAAGEAVRARPHLRRAAVLGRDTPVEDEANRLLDQLSADAGP